MTESQIISWIYLAIAMGSQESPIDHRGICMIADGINHALPTQKEMQKSIKWLLKNEIIIKKNRCYTLSVKGKEIFEKEISTIDTILETWKKLNKYVTLQGS